MAENSLEAFIETVRHELAWAPIAIFMKSPACTMAFEDLDDARDWSVFHENEIRAIYNSDYCFAHGDFGWVIIAIEINCWGALQSLIGKGIDEIVSKEEYANRRSGSAKFSVQKLFQKTFPSDVQTVVHIDDKQDRDFYELRDALAYTQQHAIHGYLYFAQTPARRWLILQTINEDFAALGQNILFDKGFKCISINDALERVRDGIKG